MLSEMAPAYGTPNDVDRHLAAAVLSLAGSMPMAGPAEVRELLRVGRLLASAQRRLRVARNIARG